MPKGTRKHPNHPKAKCLTKKKLEQIEASDDDSNFDAGSVYSVNTVEEDSHSENGDPTADDGFCDDFEDKLVDAMEQATDKSAKTRINSLNLICKGLKSKFMFDFVFDRKITLIDLVERSLKKGKGEEQVSAAALSSLLASTLGPGEDTDTIFLELHSILLTIVNDTTASPAVRTECIYSLGLVSFIFGDGPELWKPTMDSMYRIFLGSCYKGDGTVPLVTPANQQMHSAALQTWSLLLTLCSVNVVSDLALDLAHRLAQLLESSDLDVRIGAGEAFAVIYEISREVDTRFKIPQRKELIIKLQSLANDGHKFRAKKDRKVQKSSFRDILRTVEDGEPIEMTVKFGRERLVIDSWSCRKQHDAFCSALGLGFIVHLAHNDLLRDIFGLGGVSLDGSTLGLRNDRLQRKMENEAIQKARDKVRGKQRDKRADIVNLG